MATTRPMTAEELFEIGDDGRRLELVEGIVRETEASSTGWSSRRSPACSGRTWSSTDSARSWRAIRAFG